MKIEEGFNEVKYQLEPSQAVIGKFNLFTAGEWSLIMHFIEFTART